MSRVRLYAQLVRLPNVFTAMADIGLGLLAAGGSLTGWGTGLLLLLASSCLYSAGMVWNDFFDVEQDRRERPFRPLPSGKVTRRSAAWFGLALLVAGLACAFLAGFRAGMLAVVLGAAILLYDGWLKRTPAGPLAMGTCRFLNVLLGWQAAVAVGRPWPPGVHLAGVVGLYIVGVTWFARTEATTSRRSTLRAAAGVMLAALALGLLVPVWFPPSTSSPLFPYLLVGFAFLVGVPVWRAMAQPTPSYVQAAVKRTILGLVVLDAVLATAVVGVVGLVILVLLPPALYLGRWIYST